MIFIGRLLLDLNLLNMTPPSLPKKVSLKHVQTGHKVISIVPIVPCAFVSLDYSVDFFLRLVRRIDSIPFLDTIFWPSLNYLCEITNTLELFLAFFRWWLTRLRTL